jgi:hypothetical protein
MKFSTISKKILSVGLLSVCFVVPGMAMKKKREIDNKISVYEIWKKLNVENSKEINERIGFFKSEKAKIIYTLEEKAKKEAKMREDFKSLKKQLQLIQQIPKKLIENEKSKISLLVKLITLCKEIINISSSEKRKKLYLKRMKTLKNELVKSMNSYNSMLKENVHYKFYFTKGGMFSLIEKTDGSVPDISEGRKIKEAIEENEKLLNKFLDEL